MAPASVKLPECRWPAKPAAVAGHQRGRADHDDDDADRTVSTFRSR